MATRGVWGVPLANPLQGTGFTLWTFRICIFGFLVIAVCLGGPAVRLGALAAAVLVPLADHSGGLRHVLSLGGLASGVALVGPLAGLGVPLLSGPLGGPVAFSFVAVAAVGATTVVAWLIGRRLARGLPGHRYLYVLNRVAGMLLGLAEGALFALGLCWVLDLFGPAAGAHAARLVESHPKVGWLLGQVDTLSTAVLDDDSIGSWAARVNPLRGMPWLVAWAAVAEATGDREAFWQTYDDGWFDDLLAHPLVQARIAVFQANPRLRHAAKVRDLTTLLTSREFAEALREDDLCRLVAAHWSLVRTRVSESKIRHLWRTTRELDGLARTRAEELERRAREFGVRLP